MKPGGLDYLAERQVVVLGGSSGIGLAVAAAAIGSGAKAHLVARNAARLNDACAHLGNGATAAVADVADEAALGAALRELETIDHVYCAAGAYAPGEVHDGDLASFRRALDVRLWGSVLAVRAAMPYMTAGGSFVFTGGLASARPHGGAWITSVATAAAEQLGRAIAPTLGRLGLRANAVSPGWTDTPMWDDVLSNRKHAAFDAARDAIPLNRIARPEEIAAAVIFLFQNRFVTGEVIHVDGGHRWS